MRVVYAASNGTADDWDKGNHNRYRAYVEEYLTTWRGKKRWRCVIEREHVVWVEHERFENLESESLAKAIGEHYLDGIEGKLNPPRKYV